ncbi:MAG: ATP-binding protein [Chloroflexota bacterium]|nr:ATP-binding protein [Chloroflexota bacterium]
MSTTALDILNVFVESPGNLIFFLLVIALSQGSLFLAFGHRSRFPFEHATRRFVVAAAGLVIIWLVMLAAAFLAQFSALDADAFMPPLERIAYAITLLILAWAFLSADFYRWQHRSNMLVFATAFLLALLYLNSARGWLMAHEEGLAFNSTDYAPLWSAVIASLAAMGLLLAVLNFGKVVDAPLKLLFFMFFVLGNGWDLYQFSQGAVEGNYLGAARLAYLAGLVLLPLIIYRLAVALLEHSLVEVVLAASQPSPAVSQAPSPAEAPAAEDDSLLASPSSWSFSASQAPPDRRHLLNAIGVMLETREGSRIPDQIVKAALDSLQVEVCALLRMQDDRYADVIAGYDQVVEGNLSGVSLNLNEQPTLREAALRREQTILFPEYHAEELQDLFRRLNIPSLSSVYAQPLTIEGELIAVMLVAMPYRQADLSPVELESLRDIGFVAGYLLAWSFDAASSQALSNEQALEAIAEGPDETAVDQEALLANRLELEASLERVRERGSRIARQITDLTRQQQEQHVRLLDALAEGDKGQDAVQRLDATFAEQAQLRDAYEASARQLLDAEMVLRVLNVGNGEALAQVIREYMHKEYNLLLTTRDRLRRQINALLVMGRSLESDGYAAILQTLADESAQLELEREQQRRRLDSIVGKLESLGINADVPHLTQVLIQLYAERMTHRQSISKANQDRQSLLHERRKLLESGNGANEELERQLERLTADHEQLLNSREELRREQQALQTRVDDVQAANAGQQAQNAELQTELAAGEARQRELGRQVKELLEERDNLLKIRDQLTSKVNATLDAEPSSESKKEMESDIAELQASVKRLTDQREQLALELSDARNDLSTARESLHEATRHAADETQKHQLNVPELFSGMLEDLRGPMTSISDYTDLLLAESIGILGAAQQQVLNMVASDIDRLAEMIAEIQKIARLDVRPFTLEYGQIDLISLIEDVIEEASPDIAEKGQMVELALGDQLPPVRADGASFKHVFAELVMNACMVSAAGSTIAISASAGRLQLPNATDLTDAIEICVCDTGGGIAPDDRQRVFARQYRVNNPEIAGLSNSGVAMTVARAFARAHDGDLWITSEAGEGSVFHLALPMQVPAPIED